MIASLISDKFSVGTSAWDSIGKMRKCECLQKGVIFFPSSKRVLPVRGTQRKCMTLAIDGGTAHKKMHLLSIIGQKVACLKIIFENWNRITHTEYRIVHIEQRMMNSLKTDRIIIEYIRILGIWSFNGGNTPNFVQSVLDFFILHEFECDWVKRKVICASWTNMMFEITSEKNNP